MLQRKWLKRESLAKGEEYSVERNGVDASFEICAADWTSGVVNMLKEQWEGIRKHAKKLYDIEDLDERIWTAAIFGSEADQPSVWTESVQISSSTVNEDEAKKLAELMLKACVVLSKGDAKRGFVIMPSRMHTWWGQLLEDDVVLGNNRLAVDEGTPIIHSVRKDLFMDRIGGMLSYVGASDGLEFEAPVDDPFSTGNDSDASDEAAQETQAVDGDSENGEGVTAVPPSSDEDDCEERATALGDQASSDDEGSKPPRATKRKEMEAVSDDDDEGEPSPSKRGKTTADLDVIYKWVEKSIDKSIDRGWRGAGHDETFEQFIRELVNAYSVETAVQTGFMAELKKTRFAREGQSDQKILSSYLLTSMIPLSMAHRRRCARFMK